MAAATQGDPSGTDAGTRMLPRSAVVLLALAAAVVIGAGMRAANSLIAPMVLALVLTIAVAPVRRAAIRHRWPSWAATLAMLVTAYGIVLFLLVSVAAAVVQLAVTLPDYADRADDITANLQKWFSDLGFADTPTTTALDNLDLGKVTGLLTDLLNGLLGVLSSIFFLATLLFFLTADAGSVHIRATLLRDRKPALVEAMSDFGRRTQTYLVVTTLFGAIVAVLDTIAMYLLDVPLPLLWGLLSFVTNFIPNIGFVIGLIPPAILGLLDGGWEKMLAVIAVYCVLNVVIQTFIQPRFVGDAVGLNPTVTFLSLTVWTFVLGPLGALLAVPMTLLVKSMLVDADPNAQWAGLILGSTPHPPGSATAQRAPAEEVEGVRDPRPRQPSRD